MKLISVVIPTYSEGNLLLEAVDSVKKQSYKNIEIIIINDGSEHEETLSVLNTLRTDNLVKVIDQNNGGPSNARNTGIDASSGDYILPLDSDDTITEDYILKTSKILDENPDVHFVNTHGNYFGLKDGTYLKEDYSPYMLAWENIVGNSALVKREAVESVKGYTESFEGYEDWDFWLKIVAKGYKWKLLPEHLLNYRVRDNSRSKKNRENFSKFTNELLENNKNFFIENYKEIYIAGKQRWYKEFLKNKSLKI